MDTFVTPELEMHSLLIFSATTRLVGESIRDTRMRHLQRYSLAGLKLFREARLRMGEGAPLHAWYSDLIDEAIILVETRDAPKLMHEPTKVPSYGVLHLGPGDRRGATLLVDGELCDVKLPVIKTQFELDLLLSEITQLVGEHGHYIPHLEYLLREKYPQDEP